VAAGGAAGVAVVRAPGFRVPVAVGEAAASSVDVCAAGVPADDAGVGVSVGARGVSTSSVAAVAVVAGDRTVVWTTTPVQVGEGVAVVVPVGVAVGAGVRV